MIYLDNAATTQIDPEVLFGAMYPYLTKAYGNPGAVCKLGREAKQAVDLARKQVAEFIGAHTDQIIFTSGGTEANNTALHSAAEWMRKNGYTDFLMSRIEHDSIWNSVKSICSRTGFTYSTVDPDRHGVIQLGEIERVLTPDTGFVTVMCMNNETGSKNDVAEIYSLCQKKGALFLTDCVHSAASCRPDAKHADFISISSHKLHGPKGVGALFVRDPQTIDPLITGGASQEYGLRGGTENVAGIVGFGMACEIMSAQIRQIDIHCSVLKQRFYTELTAKLKECGLHGIVHINGGPIVSPGRTLNLRFDGVDGETLLLFLDSKGVCVSAGSACNSKESLPSRVLLAMGLSEDEARNSVRVSFSKMNTEEEAVAAADLFAAGIRLLSS